MNSIPKRLFFVLTVNVLIVVVGVVTLEMIFGNWMHDDKLNRLNLYRSVVLTHDITALYPSTNPTARYTRDEYGLRGHFGSPSEIDILTVGGSTTDQRYISDGQTWQHVLQQEFSSSGREVVVANAGVDGQSTFGHVLNFAYWFARVPNLRPRVILYYVGLNDFCKDEGYFFDDLYLQDGEKSLSRSIRHNSALFHLARTVYGTYLAKYVHNLDHEFVNYSRLEWTQLPARADHEQLMEFRLHAYAARLQMLCDKTSEIGARAIFVTQPSRKYRFVDGQLLGIARTMKYDDADINGVDFYLMMRRIDGVTIRVATENGCTCIDLAGEEAIWEDGDFYDFAHMTPSGARKLGLYLYQRMSDEF